jgi:hypothetical protein
MGELVFDFNFSPDEPDEKIINSFSNIINEKDLNIAYLKKISCALDIPVMLTPFSGHIDPPQG